MSGVSALRYSAFLLELRVDSQRQGKHHLLNRRLRTHVTRFVCCAATALKSIKRMDVGVLLVSSLQRASTSTSTEPPPSPHSLRSLFCCCRGEGRSSFTADCDATLAAGAAGEDVSTSDTGAADAAQGADANSSAPASPPRQDHACAGPGSNLDPELSSDYFSNLSLDPNHNHVLGNTESSHHYRSRLRSQNTPRPSPLASPPAPPRRPLPIAPQSSVCGAMLDGLSSWRSSPGLNGQVARRSRQLVAVEKATRGVAWTSPSPQSKPRRDERRVHNFALGPVHAVVGSLEPLTREGGATAGATRQANCCAS